MKKLIPIIFYIVSVSVSSAQIVVSDFSTGTDSWTANGDSGIVYNAAGYVTSSDYTSVTGLGPPIPAYWYFAAPAKFTGNKSVYYNGSLSFDFQENYTRAAVSTRADIILTDVTGTQIFYFSVSPAYPAHKPSWTTYSVPLNELSGGWKTTNSPTGTAVSQAAFIFTMTNMQSLQIRGRYGAAPNTKGSLDNVMLTPFVIATQPTNQTVCSGTTAVLTTLATGKPAITYQWQENVAGAYINVTNGANYSGAQTPTLSILTTPTIGGGNYLCVVSSPGAHSITTNVVLVKVNNSPSITGTTPGSGCAPATINLAATGGGTGLYRWYAASTGGTAFATGMNGTYTTPALNVTTTYYVAVNNGTCEGARVAVVATVLPLPGAPTTSGGVTCSSGAVTLTAAGGSAGQYRWYTVATGGVALTGQTNSTYTTPVINVSTTYYVSVNNGCEGPRTPVVAQVVSVPTAPIATGNNACASNPVQELLTATGGSAGQYRWYTVATAGSPIAGQTSGSYTTAPITSTTTYYVSINNGTCESSRTAVTATVLPTPSVPQVAGAPTCGPNAVELRAAGASPGQYYWYTDLTSAPVPGQTNDTFDTPVVNTTTTFYAAINNGTCVSARVPVVATVYPIPGAPIAKAVSGCSGATFKLTAAGGTAGQYLWYTSLTGTPLAGQTSNTYTTPALTASTTFYVSVSNGQCESPRTPVAVNITPVCDQPPVIASSTSDTQVDGVVTISLAPLVTDPDGNQDLSTLSIIAGPTSGAKASINSSYQLTVDYSDVASFSGQDTVTVQVCDKSGLCTQQMIFIEVNGDVTVYQGFSPNGDAYNPIFFIKNINALQDTKHNHVTIFNRWGDKVFEIDDYDNSTHVFSGLNKSGSELATGTYFYKIEFTSGKKSLTGYLSLKR